MEVLAVIFSGAALLVSVITMTAVLSGRGRAVSRRMKEEFREMNSELKAEFARNREELDRSVRGNVESLGNYLGKSQETLRKTVVDMTDGLDRRFADFTKSNEMKLEAIRESGEKNINSMREANEARLNEIRGVVDEKLQKTLEERFNQSFKLISERLEAVHKGLGEMQNVAAGVDDLKKVLSNVKTRGILGEISLGNILEQILNSGQYEENIATKPGSTERVEFAVRLPGEGDGRHVYLPIDAKFPLDRYSALLCAYDSGNAAEIEAAYKELAAAIRKNARDIREKYIAPPHTTDFAIMYLPVEGLYAEVVRRGLIEELQSERYKINIAGPTTMAALLNSLQMGFKTLAIQKRSGEVWDILSAVKTEFGKFGSVLSETQKKLDQANSELGKLIGTRTRMIQSKLRSVSVWNEEDAARLLEDTGNMPFSDDRESGPPDGEEISGEVFN